MARDAAALALVALMVVASNLACAEALELRTMRKVQELPTPKYCMFDSSNTVSTAWFRYGWYLATPAAATACINQVQIDAAFAIDSLTQLARVFNSSYVFTAVAANPYLSNYTVIPQYNYSLFNTSSDVPGSLLALAASYANVSTVPLGDINFMVNEIFNKLYDLHVIYAGATDRPGTVFGNALTKITHRGSAGSTRAYLVDKATGAIMIGLGVHQPGFPENRTIAVSGQFMLPSGAIGWQTFDAINDQPPFDWFVQLVQHPSLRLCCKALGARINELISNFNFPLTSMGRLDQLPEANVTLNSGQTSVLTWGITVPPAISGRAMTTIQEAANSPGVPFMALSSALLVFVLDPVKPKPADAPAPSLLDVLQAEPHSYDLQATFNATITPLNDDSGNMMGFYYFNGSNAVLKLITFEFDPSLLKSWWPAIVTDAHTANATQLVLDLINNDGGVVLSGVMLILGLFPGTLYGDLGLRYDRVMGPDAEYFYGNNLMPRDIGAVIDQLMANETWVTSRTAQLNANATDLLRLAQQTNLTLEAITVLFGLASFSQAQVCQNYTATPVWIAKCSEVWQPLAQNLTAALNATLLNPAWNETVNEQILDDVVHRLVDMLWMFWPYAGASDVNGTNPYKLPRTLYRGGQLRNYTAPFDLLNLPKNSSYLDYYPTLANTSSPFTKILALTDGMCGSACDIFSRTSWFYSLLHPSAPVFKFASFGGTGNMSDSSATSFPGGNVVGDDYLTPAWAYFVTLGMLAEWANLPDLTQNAEAWGKLLPTFPAFLDNYMPQYTQSEYYQTAALGLDSMPMEYINIPSDVLINGWFKRTGLPRSDAPSDLPVLYNTCFDILNSMPGPTTSS